MTVVANNNRILAVKTHALGDVLMVTPAIRALRKKYPEAQIDFLIGDWSRPAVDSNPHINNIISFPDENLLKKKYLKIISLRNKIKSGNYDLAVLFQPSDSVRKLIRLSQIPTIAGLYSGSAPTSLKYAVLWRKERDRYVGEDFMDVVRAIGGEDDGLGMEFRVSKHQMKEAKNRYLEDYKIHSPYVILCASGGRNPRDYVKQKIWSSKRYAQITERLINRGYTVIVTALESERMNLLPVLQVKGTIDLAGKTSLSDLACLMKDAALTITNDSVPMHLAIIQNTPAVIIFGPTRIKALLPSDGRFIAVASNAECAPCYDNEPFPGCGRTDCIDSVTVDMVWSNVEKALQQWEK